MLIKLIMINYLGTYVAVIFTRLIFFTSAEAVCFKCKSESFLQTCKWKPIGKKYAHS